MVLSFALCAAELDLGDEINDSSYVQVQMMHNRRSLRVLFEALRFEGNNTKRYTACTASGLRQRI